MSKKLLALNVALAGLAVFLGVWLVRDLAAKRVLPPPPAPRKVATSPPSEEPKSEKAAQDHLAAYNGIVTKYLFNPTRSETTGQEGPAKPAVPLPPKPLLLGVVVDGPSSRAYLEDPASKRVFGYQVGDTVAGGKLEKITDDRIQISRSDGAMEVMLRDPTKPRPAPPPATPGAQTPGGQPAAPAAPGTPGSAVPPGARGEVTPQVPGRTPVPPRSLRRVPAEQQQSSSDQ